jgi:hypothetical protein
VVVTRWPGGAGLRLVPVTTAQMVPVAMARGAMTAARRVAWGSRVQRVIGSMPSPAP